MTALNIVCISDTHGKHAGVRLPDGDILIHAGDFMTYGDRLSEIASFNHWLSKQPHRHKVVIAGNHDLLFESDASLARTQIMAAAYLENSATEIEGVHIWGSPQQPRFLDWAFNVDRGPSIRRYWDMIPAETDILITHGPPFGILDKINPSGEHLGCEELTIAVQRVRPKLHIFGHIHGGHGKYQDNGIQYVNASVLDKNYRISHSLQVVTLVF